MAHWRSTLDPALYPAAGEVEPGGKAVDWSAIWAGTAAAIAITLLLLALGAGFGLASVSPWPGVGAQASTFSIGAGIWLIVMQWVSSSVGGYLAGRMRSRWHGLHSDETFFRDTAQGLITWSVATMIVAGVAVLMTTLAGLAGTDQSDPNMSAAMVEEARKAGMAIALFTGFSMLVGGFIACVSAAIGGRLRDRHP
ncbi:MAG: hypothetical protein JWQ16_2717 [Novosphingobium sp.]|nr:hypothetical protein [Novosphingobium sp.]